MKLLGLSNIETLLSILLIESCWWTALFFNSYLIIGARFLENPSYNFSRQRTGWNKWIFLASGILMFLRLKAPLLLLITVLKNRLNEHCQLIKIWFYMSNILDFVLVVYYIVVRIWLSNFKESTIGLLSEVVLFLILRVIIILPSRRFVSDLTIQDGTLFPVPGITGIFKFLSKHVESLVKVILVWQLFWNLIKLSQFLDFHNKESFFVPWFYRSFNLIAITNSVLPCVICAILLLAVHKKWKLFSGVLIVPYFAIILLGTVYLIGDTTMRKIYLYKIFTVFASDIFALTITYFLLIGDFILKLIGFIGIVCLVWNKSRRHYWVHHGHGKQYDYDDKKPSLSGGSGGAGGGEDLSTVKKPLLGGGGG